MIGTDRQMQGIAGPQAHCMLICEAGRCTELKSRHGDDREAVGGEPGEFRQYLRAVVGIDLPGQQLDREGRGELGRDPIANCEIVLRLSSKPVLHPLGFRLVGQGRKQQRGVQIEHQ